MSKIDAMVQLLDDDAVLAICNAVERATGTDALDRVLALVDDPAQQAQLSTALGELTWDTQWGAFFTGLLAGVMIRQQA